VRKRKGREREWRERKGRGGLHPLPKISTVAHVTVRLASVLDLPLHRKLNFGETDL